MLWRKQCRPISPINVVCLRMPMPIAPMVEVGACLACHNLVWGQLCRLIIRCYLACALIIPSYFGYFATPSPILCNYCPQAQVAWIDGGRWGADHATAVLPTTTTTDGHVKHTICGIKVRLGHSQLLCMSSARGTIRRARVHRLSC